MRPIKTMFIVFAILIMLPAYSQDNKDLRKKIEKINNKMADYLVKGDYTAGMHYYSEDAISMPNWSPMIKGKEAMAKENESMHEMGVKFNHFDFTTMEVMRNGDMLVELGTYKMSLNMPQMPEAMHDHGKYVTIWEIQDDGSLKIKAEIWNTDQNPMEMMGERMHDEKKMHEKEMHEKHERPKKEIKSAEEDKR